MSSYDIKCKLIEEELKSFWPQWHVIRRLGGGAFGDVFEIYKDNFGIREKSALKMIQISDEAETYSLLSPAGGAGARAQNGQGEIPEAFRNEIQIMEALRGAPNIVIIDDFHLKRDASSSMLFVRMELLNSFQKMMTERRRDQLPFTIPEVLKIGRDICNALMYCETKGIIHRDIKPANLFIDGFGDYKVGDFGVSKRMDTVHVALTMTGIGTISYMAPEVYKGRSYNNTVDIYALGLILYQLLNDCRIPFLPADGSYTTKDIDSANYKRLHGEPLPSLTGTRIGNGTVDASLDAIIRKACALRPEDRYQSAKALYNDLTVWGTQHARLLQQDIPKRQPREDMSKVQSREDIPKGQPEYIEQSRTTPFYFVKDAEDVRKDSSQNSAREAQDKMKPAEDSSDSDHSPGPVPGDDDKKSRDEKKKGRPGIIIPVILSAVVLLICIGYKIMSDSQQSPSYSSGSELSEDLPVSDEEIKGTISDSWEEIIAAGEDGSYADKYQIGDIKELDLGEEGLIRMELAAMDTDELADESGEAHMTWIAKDQLSSKYFMNEEVTNADGWQGSDMRSWLRESILPLFPENVRSNIKEVTKYSYGYDYSSKDTIWIPSEREVFGTDIREDRGPKYSLAFSDNKSRIRYQYRTSNASWWWLRSAREASCFTSVGSNGSNSSRTAAAEGGVVIGFCF